MSKRGKHKSVCPAADRALRRLEASDLVSKVILGASHNCRHKYSPGHLKLQRTENAGLKVNCYGGNGVTTMYVYCNPADREQVKQLLDS